MEDNNWITLIRIVDGKKLKDMKFYKESPNDMDVLSRHISTPPYTGRIQTNIKNNTVTQIITTNN